MEIKYEFVEDRGFFAFFRENRKVVFKNEFDFNIGKVLSDEEKMKNRQNWETIKGVKRNYLVAKNGEEIVGWSFGMQTRKEDYYMINSAVFPAFRNKGIYTQMMKLTVEKAKDDGFQRIYSRHKMDNNQILIPKLKFGFVITGFEVTDIFGNLVQLSYYVNPKRRELLKIRIGSEKINDSHLDLIE